MGCGWEAETTEQAELELGPGTPCDTLSSGRPLELLRAAGDAMPWAHLGSSLERRGAVKTFLETCDSDCYFKTSSGSEPSVWSSVSGAPDSI